MKIYSERIEFDENLNLEQIKNKIETSNKKLLRFAIVEKAENKTVVEVVILEDGINIENHNKILNNSNKFGVVCVVPTGVNAAVGGFIADVTPTINTLAEICDVVITHPNCVNGSLLNYAADNVLYVEGSILDDFLNNKIALKEVLQNRVGVIIDRGALESDKTLNTVINVIESLRVIAGINCIGYKITDEPIGGHAIFMPSKSFSGEVKNSDTLIKAGKELIEAGATALAVATHIDIDNMEKDLDKYFKGELANPFGSCEAIISHTLCKLLHVPAAHAPILSQKEIDYYNNCGIVDPRAAPEIASPNYLGCILKGLNKAPQISDVGITLDNVKAIIVPYNSCGGVPMLMSQKYNIPLICVRENVTCLNVTPELMHLKNYIIAENYLEAIGIVAALKAGITIESLRRPFKSIHRIV